MPESILEEWERGLAFRKGDRLRPRTGCHPFTFSVAGDEVTVYRQNCLVPSRYTVLGRIPSEPDPSKRIIQFEINGHEWERIEGEIQ